MKVYLVGGAVRDQMLGLKASDRDFVVTETTNEELLKNGFQKVGQTFPVYLDPVTKEEYTLAQDLLKDLKRRDLTINAMAIDESGHLIDPFEGKADLEKKILKHVSRENFVIDPVRIIRTARFAAFLPEFKVHAETVAMIKEIVPVISIKDIPSERPLKELMRVLSASSPEIFFSMLNDWGALNVFYPELVKSDMNFLRSICKVTDDVCIRFASLTKGLTKEELDHLSKRLLLSNECYYAGQLVVRHLDQFNRALSLSAEQIIDLFYDMDVFRKPESLSILGTLGDEKAHDHLQKCFDKIRDVSFKDVSQDISGKDIGAAIRKLRTDLLLQT